MRWRAMEWAHWIATSSAEAEAPCEGEGDDDGQEEAAFYSILFSPDTDEAIAFRTVHYLRLENESESFRQQSFQL